jgi:hypothetical protein
VLRWGGATPLSYAARGGLLEAVKLLAEREDVEMNPVDGEPLVLAACYGHSEVVEYLTGKPELGVNTVVLGETPIFQACAKPSEGSLIS